MTAPDHTLAPFKITCTNGGIHTCTNGVSYSLFECKRPVDTAAYAVG